MARSATSVAPARPGASGRRPRRTGAVVAGCAALAGLSLALPSAPAFDPWAWLVWGREVAGGDLDTTGGPSWKPLPVLITTALAPFGDAAPDLWLFAARTAGLGAVALAYRLAARFAGLAAGVVAGGALLLTPDAGSRFLRTVAEGHAAPVLVALCLGAVERHLAGRHGVALGLGWAVALLRPEAWPFLGLYAAWLWWRHPSQRILVTVLVASVPVLWFGGDWWGSGDWWNGGGRAQVADGGAADRLGLALSRIAAVVTVPVWVAAALGVVQARLRARTIRSSTDGASCAVRGFPGAVAARWRAIGPEERLALLAVAWLGLVAAMTTLGGYAALSRFLGPAGALLCVLASVGAVRGVSALVASGWSRSAVLAVVIVATAPFALPRALALQEQAADVLVRARLDHHLGVVVERAGGPEAVVGCGTVAVDQSGPSISVRPGLAWKLGLPLGQVRSRLGDQPGVLFTMDGGPEDERLSARPAPEVRPLARSEGWAAYAVRCPPGSLGS